MIIRKRIMGSIILCILLISIVIPVLIGIERSPEETFGGKNVFVLTASAAGNEQLNVTLAEKIESQDFALTVSPEVYCFCVLKNNPVLVRGVWMKDFIHIENGKIAEGKTGEAMIGEGIAERMNVEVGDDLTITGSTSPSILEVQISGIYSTHAPSNDEIIIPLSSARKLSGLSTPIVSLIRVKTDNKDLLVDFLGNEPVNIVVSDMAGGETETGNETYEEYMFKYSEKKYESSEKYVSMFVQKSRDSVRLVIYSFIVLSSLLTSIGIATTLSKEVIEKERDIGIISAIGAGKMRMRMRMMREMLIISIPSSITGILLGFIGVYIIKSSNILIAFGHQIQPVINVNIFLSILLASILVCCSVGLLVNEQVITSKPKYSIQKIEEREKEVDSLIEVL